MTVEEITEKLKELLAKLEGSDDLSEEQIDEIEQQVDELQEEKKSLEAKAEKRSQALAKARALGAIKEEIKDGKEERKMEEKKVFETAEYRSAYLKRLQGKELTEAEERTLTSATGSAGAVMPSTTLDLVMEKVEEQAPLLQEIELMRVDGNITFAVEADATEANIHAEGATMTEDGDVLIPVTLSTYEITKYITVSKTVAKMSVDAFERWLTNMLARRIARKIVKLIISGTGSNQPKGIAFANAWDEKNSVTIGKDANLTEANVVDLVGLLPGAYDANAKWLMSKKTLMTYFRPLQNKSKNDIFVRENGKFYVEGHEVMLDDGVPLYEAYLGNFKMYAGNLGEDVTIDTDKKLSSNVFEFLGVANFDGKPAIGEAFVKLAKAAE